MHTYSVVPYNRSANQVPGVKVQLTGIPPGEAGTDATVKKLGQLVQQSLAGQQLRMLALKILNTYGVPNHNPLAAARALFRYVRSRIRYVPDPRTIETVQAPEVTLRLRAGDCDDHSGLVAGLAAAIGIPARFVVVGRSAERFAHIYPELFINGKWMAADTTRPGATFGTPAPRLGAVKRYSLEGKPMYLGLGENPGTKVRAVAIPKSTLEAWAYRGAITTMRHNWNAGKINRQDVQGYLQTIDAGNGPGRGTFAEAPMRRAVADFLGETTGKASSKPPGNSGLEGLDGFLGSVWNGVKKVVSTGVKLVTGGGTTTVQVQPPVFNIPAVTTTVSPDSARAGVGAFLSNPVTLVALGVGALLLVTAVMKK